MKRSKFVLAVIVGLLCFASGARAWDRVGHQLVTQLAINALPDEFPAWVKDPERATRMLYLCAEPDRWRGQGAPVLNHINNPDHYMDIEELAAFGLTVKTLPRFRNEFVERLATIRANDPNASPYDSSRDSAHVYSTPGLIPYAIIERYWKLASSWSILKTFEEYSDIIPRADIESARNNVIQEMGLLSHFVGDGNQPLHMTMHHHGWKGDNPNGYTTGYAIHDYIDATVLSTNNITVATIGKKARPASVFDPKDPWEQLLVMLDNAHGRVEPLYKLEKEGQLDKKAGREFIKECVIGAGADLAGLWVAAYQASKIDSYMAGFLDLIREQRNPKPPAEPEAESAPISDLTPAASPDAKPEVKPEVKLEPAVIF